MVYTCIVSSGAILLFNAMVLMLFNRPFYRYGGHFEQLSFAEYYGVPRGQKLKRNNPLSWLVYGSSPILVCGTTFPRT